LIDLKLENFIFSAVILLAVTSVAVVLSRRLGLGSILGLLVAGIIVGPHTPGRIITEVEEVRRFTELGVVFLLFLIGLEMRPNRLWSMRREVFGLGTLQIVITGLVIAAYMMTFQGTWEVALFTGFTLALSSTAFVLQILQERGEIASRHGSTSFSILLMQDLAVVPLLAVVPVISDTGTLSGAIPLWEKSLIVIGTITAVVLGGNYIVPRVLHRLARLNNREAFFMTVMLAVLTAAWAMHYAGLSMALGAFLIGIALSHSKYNYQIQASIEPYKGILMSLFFVAVGMSIDFKTLAQQPLLFGQHILVILVIKTAVLFVLCLAFKTGRVVATRVAFFLSQSGEFGFVLFGSAKMLAVIDDTTFVIAIGVISSTMLLTPVFVRLGDWIALQLAALQEDLSAYRYDGQDIGKHVRVVIAGFGRVGHTVAAILQHSDISYIAFDTNSTLVESGKEEDFPVYYGDIGEMNLLENLDMDRVEIVIITIDNTASAQRAISHIRSLSQDVHIITRARDLKTCDDLLEAGANKALPEALENSLALSAEALAALGVDVDDTKKLLDRMRGRNYATVREALEMEETLNSPDNTLKK